MSNSFYILLFLLFLSCTSKIDDNFIINNNKKYWTNDIDEIEKVMSYILDYDAYKDLSRLDKNKKIDYIDNYFKSIDPDTTTIYNESIAELSRRVKTSKDSFSGSDGGLYSDRAKIFIVYGTPKDIYNTYINNQEAIVWEYQINDDKYEFYFINDSFGKFKLIVDDFNYINN